MPGFVRQGLEAGTLVLALSLDAFFASLAYGAGEIRLPGKSALVVALHNPKAQNECGCGESFGV